MIKEPGYYWAYDDEERPQLIEILGNGTCLVPGVEGPVRENSFVYIRTPRIEPVPFSACDCGSSLIIADEKSVRCAQCDKKRGAIVEVSAPSPQPHPKGLRPGVRSPSTHQCRCVLVESKGDKDGSP